MFPVCELFRVIQFAVHLAWWDANIQTLMNDVCRPHIEYPAPVPCHVGTDKELKDRHTLNINSGAGIPGIEKERSMELSRPCPLKC